MMKTVNLFSAAALLAATVMTSCNNKIDEAVNSNGRVEVKFASAQAGVETRVTGTDWDGGEQIGIYMLTGDYTLTAANISEGVSNREYENTAVSPQTAAIFTPPSPAGTIYYPAGQSGNVVDVKFIAYYPHGTVTDNSTSFMRAIDVSSQTDQSAIDYLYAPAGTVCNKNSGTVTLPFAHKLVKLVFNIGKDPGVSASLSGLTAEITAQETVSALDLTTGDVPVSNGGPTTIEALTVGNGQSSEAIVLPLGNTAGVRFVFTNTAGEEFTGTVPDAAWQGGKKYTYNVTLKKNEAIITGTITDWDDGNTGQGIDAN
jgi:hypothetical protein